jgi:peptidoglycan/LPS O-acetylase OafA/YrhL
LLPLKVPKRAVVGLAWIFAALLCASLILVRRSSMSFAAAEWTVAILFALLLYVLLHQTEQAALGIYQKGSKFLSQISYTLYLVHMPLAVFLCAWMNRPWHTWSKTIPNVVAAVGLCGFLVVFAYAFYLAFEANTDRVRAFLFEGGGDRRQGGVLRGQASSAAK